MALVDPDVRGRSARALSVDVRGHREPARVVKLPFYKRPARPRRTEACDRSPAIRFDRRILEDLTAWTRRPSDSRRPTSGCHLDGDVATVGISKFAVDQLTDLIMIELPAVGTRLAAGKSFGEVESVKAVSDLYAPVGGEVVEVNTEVAENVQLLADDPYGKGWLIKVRVDDPAAVSQLMDHDAYEKKVAEEAH